MTIEFSDQLQLKSRIYSATRWRCPPMRTPDRTTPPHPPHGGHADGPARGSDDLTAAGRNDAAQPRKPEA